jgi:hypothetical protein
MPIALAEQTKRDAAEDGAPGAPILTDAIDPELVKLGRKRLQIGAITSIAAAALCAFFAIRLGPDRHFASEGDTPHHATPAQVLDGSVAVDSFVALHGEPLVAHAVRAASSKGAAGERVVPVRGTGDRLWLVEPGDAFGDPTPDAYVGRLRKLADLPLADAVRAFVAANPRPMFATVGELRRAFQTGTLRTVTGDDVHVDAATEVAFDIVDPDAAVIVCSFVDQLPDGPSWLAALGSAGIPLAGQPVLERDAVLVDVTLPQAVATATTRLDDAKLYAARVDPVTRHYDTTWATIAGSPSGALATGSAAVPDARADLVGVYVARSVPEDAYAVITGETPDDYDYVLPLTIALGVFTALFGWAFVRAIRRDWLPAK